MADRPPGQPLDAAVGDYLALKFRRLALDPGRVYTADVPDAIRARLTQTERHTQRAVSQCFPLSVNNLLKRAMNLAAEVGEDRVTAEIIRSL